MLQARPRPCLPSCLAGEPSAFFAGLPPAAPVPAARPHDPPVALLCLHQTCRLLNAFFAANLVEEINRFVFIILGIAGSAFISGGAAVCRLSLRHGAICVLQPGMHAVTHTLQLLCTYAS